MPKSSFPSQELSDLIVNLYNRIKTAITEIFSRAESATEEDFEDDFATRVEPPSWEEYQAASNAQILERMHRNPSGLLSEQPFIDTLMNARNVESNRQLAKHLIIAAYLLVGGIVILIFTASPEPATTSPEQFVEQQRSTDQAIASAVASAKEDFNLKLQSKELEVKELKHQISLLSQNQAELAKQVKALKAGTIPKPAIAPKPAPAATPTIQPVKPAAIHKPN
jgi:hypothetical protein